MAEYYPLLSRAVAGLREAQPEARQAIYNRARQALLTQLRSMQPAVPEADIERESTALDDAISRVEADVAASASAAAPSTGFVADRPAVAPIIATPTVAPARAAGVAVERSATDVAVGPATMPKMPPGLSPRALPHRDPPDVSAPVPTRAASRPPVEPRVPVGPATGGTPNSASQSTTAGAAGEVRVALPAGGPAPLRASRAGEEAKGDVEKPALPVAPRLQIRAAKPADEPPSQAEPALDAPVGIAGLAGEPSFEAEMRRQGDGREEAVHPAAPRRVDRKAFSPRLLIVSLVAVLVVAGIAYAAWRLRDKPEALARSRAALLAAQKAEPQPGKIVERADGGAPSTAPVPAAAPVERPPQPPTSAEPAASVPDSAPAAVVPPTAAGAASAEKPAPNTPVEPANTAATDGAAATPRPAPDQTIPVAQRAALLVEAPDEPEKVKTFVGTVVWRNENVSPGQDQPLTTAVRADVDIPSAGLTFSVLFQKNFEAQFPASHTIEIRFTPGPDNKSGSVKQISVPEMRKDDLPTGDSLAGLPVTITDNYFLVGLTRGDAEQRNLDLIKTRNWIDIRLVFTSGKIGKVTFEKGASGERLINDTIQSWR